MKSVTLTNEEIEAIIIGLQTRRNLIQTGSPNVSTGDVARIGADGAREFGAEVKALNTDQMRLCILTEELIAKMLVAKSDFPV